MKSTRTSTLSPDTCSRSMLSAYLPLTSVVVADAGADNADLRTGERSTRPARHHAPMTTGPGAGCGAMGWWDVACGGPPASAVAIARPPTRDGEEKERGRDGGQRRQCG